MSKDGDEVGDAGIRVASPTTEEIEFSESHPLRSLPCEAVSERVENFATAHGLEYELEVLHKASLALQPGVDAEQIPSITLVELQALDRERTHKWRQPWLLYFTILVASLGAIEQGWAQTGMNGANLYIPKAMDIDSNSTQDSFILGLINCGLYLGQALCGSAIAEPVNNRFGRRGAIFMASVLCLIGNLGSSISGAWPILVSFRLVLGTGLGLNASTVSVYAAECAPAYIRGGLGVCWQMFTAFGILLGFLANVACYNLGPQLIWRYQLGAPFLPTMPLIFLIYLCPESAAWHIKKSRYNPAFSSLRRLRHTKLQSACELYSAALAQENGFEMREEDELSYARKFTSLFLNPRNRYALLGSYTVMLSQMLCGINIIAFYSSTIFSSSGFSALAALWASVVFGLVNFLGALPAVWTMDTVGRRRLLLWTLPPMAVTMVFTGLTFSLPKGNVQLVLLAGLIYTFCALYSPGMGPVPCAYSAEVYPLNVREVGMSFAVATASIWATMLSLTFPSILEGLGEQGSFWLYGALNMLAWALCWCFVRETKGIRLSEMDEVFESSPMAFIRQNWDERLGSKGRGSFAEGWSVIAQEDTVDR